MIRVMVVDDEPLAREELTRLISSSKDFEVASTAINGKEALAQLKKTSVDVVFLDIDMPGMNGLDVAGELAEWEKPPLLVFATAHNHYAVKAFEANAIDYILKPFDPDRLSLTLKRVKDNLSKQNESKDKLHALDDYLVQKGLSKKLIGHKRNSKERIVIDPSQVYYFHAKLTDVSAHLANEELLVGSTLKDLVTILDPNHFAQSHKAYLVNLDKIEKLTPLFSGNYQMTLKEKGFLIPLSRRYVKKIKQMLKNW